MRLARPLARSPLASHARAPRASLQTGLETRTLGLHRERASATGGRWVGGVAFCPRAVYTHQTIAGIGARALQNCPHPRPPRSLALPLRTWHAALS